MRQRCNNQNHHAYHNYGGRGIRICEEWDDFAVFREWALKSGYDESAPRGLFTLDRIDVDLGYSPENCRWVDMRTQSNNKRNTILLSYDGKTLPLTEWADVLGLDYQLLWKRYSLGMPIEKILKQ